MGYDLMENFRRPYFARSLSEFWRRWHISLSTWFRDYLYISLGGSRVSHRRWVFNILVVFLLSGLWHGAAWTFVLWGGLHGALMVLGIESKEYRDKAARALGLARSPALRNGIRILCTFVGVTLLWVFFRANTIGDAFYILSQLTSGWEVLARPEQRLELFYLGAHRVIPFWIAVGTIAGLIGVDLLLEREPDPKDLFSARSVWFRRCFSYAMVLALIILGVFDRSEFIYFQF
jgi:hypothetical protein